MRVIKYFMRTSTRPRYTIHIGTSAEQSINRALASNTLVPPGSASLGVIRTALTRPTSQIQLEQIYKTLVLFDTEPLARPTGFTILINTPHRGGCPRSEPPLP